MQYVFGITGGSGTGKSTVCRILADHGVTILDADEIGHQLMEPGGAAYQPVVDTFGTDYIKRDGRIDRRRLGELVFGDDKALKALNVLVHPAIHKKLLEEIEKREGLIGIDAALLIEANLLSLTQELWLVTADLNVRIERIVLRDGVTRELARQRLACQLADEEKKKYAKVVLENSGDLETLKREVLRQLAELEKRWEKSKK